MWMMYATVRLGENRPIVYVADDPGTVQFSAFYIPDLLLWLQQNGHREIGLDGEDGVQVFRIDRRPVTDLPKGPPAPGRKPLGIGAGTSQQNRLDPQLPSAARRPDNWPATDDGRARKRLAQIWRRAGR